MACGTGTRGDRAQQARGTEFARLVERLSEPGGYFDTDNLISNERSYLHVVDQLAMRPVQGGAYIGVGPDQNFSYIAAVRPDIAFIVDIRRDNVLQHLMFKALFTVARTRSEYLCLLFGRPVPDDRDQRTEASVGALVAYVDSVDTTPAAVSTALDTVAATVTRFGVPLSDDDMATLRRFHEQFIREGLDLRFQSHGRPPMARYPTLRQLVSETDRTGRQVSYLASESAFRIVKSLHERDRIIPVVGDFGGIHALAAIGDLLRRRGLTVSVFYTSNVELYLMRDGGFQQFAENVARLPRDKHSVVVRSYFRRNFGYTPADAVPGYLSVQLLQSMEEFVTRAEAGGYRSYLDLVAESAVAVPQ